MKLVAVKRISAQRPAGVVFEESVASRAKALIALGVAKLYEPAPTRRRGRRDPDTVSDEAAGA